MLSIIEGEDKKTTFFSYYFKLNQEEILYNHKLYFRDTIKEQIETWEHRINIKNDIRQQLSKSITVVKFK